MDAGIGGVEAGCTDIVRRAIAAGRAGLAGPKAKLLIASFGICVPTGCRTDALARGVPVSDEMPQAAQALAALAAVDRHGCSLARST